MRKDKKKLGTLLLRVGYLRDKGVVEVSVIQGQRLPGLDKSGKKAIHLINTTAPPTQPPLPPSCYNTTDCVVLNSDPLGGKGVLAGELGESTVFQLISPDSFILSVLQTPVMGLLSLSEFDCLLFMFHTVITASFLANWRRQAGMEMCTLCISFSLLLCRAERPICGTFSASRVAVSCKCEGAVQDSSTQTDTGSCVQWGVQIVSKKMIISVFLDWFSVSISETETNLSDNENISWSVDHLVGS